MEVIFRFFLLLNYIGDWNKTYSLFWFGAGMILGTSGGRLRYPTEKLPVYKDVIRIYASIYEAMNVEY